jgi:hypothetical protein
MRTDIPEFNECSGNLQPDYGYDWIEEDVMNDLVAEDVAQEVYEETERE